MLRADRRTRALLGWLFVTACALAAAWTWSPAQAQTEAVGAGDAARGGELYQGWCGVCHVTDGGGTYAGPPLLGTSLAYNDLTMRTGRMPLTDPNQGVRQRRFTDTERADTLAYLADVLGLEGVVEEPADGTPAAGQDVYVNHCAQCHGATGAGGIAGGGALVPATRALEPLTIAQATRVGPFQMPAFDEVAISDEQLADLVAYLEPPADGLLGLAELESRVVALLFASLLGAPLVWLCVWTVRPVRAPDVEEDQEL